MMYHFVFLQLLAKLLQFPSTQKKQPQKNSSQNICRISASVVVLEIGLFRETGLNTTSCLRLALDKEKWIFLPIKTTTMGISLN